jgi:hypothetical protein
MLTARRIALLIATAAALVATPAAQAATPPLSTTYYSINTTPVGAGTDWFLTADGAGHVTTQRYRSTDPLQQWTPVSPDFPGADPLTTGPTNWRCFTGICGYDEEHPLIEKFLNRATGMCLTVLSGNGQSRGTFLSQCAPSGTRRAEQTWTWYFRQSDLTAGVPTRYTALVQKIQTTYGCAALNMLSTTPGVGMRLSRCDRPASPAQSFRFLRVGTVSCTYAQAVQRVCGTIRR